MALPQRKRLPHTPPPWVKAGSIFFISLNCTPSGRNQLCYPEIASSLFETIRFRQNRSIWHVRLALFMPDHIHGLISFPMDQAMPLVIAKWKEHISYKFKISWQRDFFDHRIRDNRSLEEKEHYILNNPVRKGLVDRPEDWPYQLHAEEI